MEFGVYDPFLVLQFLRDETGHQGSPAATDAAGTEGTPDAAVASTSSPP
jgi:hypothetical protein